MRDLLQESDKWKSEAEKLLVDSKLKDVLGQHGEVVATGSFAYDLMLGPDIDLYLVHENPEQTATALLQALIRQRFWNGYLFYDWLHFKSDKHAEFPRSFYVGLKTTHNEHRWKADIWILSPKMYHGTAKEWMNAKISLEARALILSLKEERNRSGFDISSYQIYDAVLNRGAVSLDEVAASP